MLLYKTSGITYYLFGDKRLRISEGDLIYIPDGTSYSVETPSTGGYITVVFSCGNIYDQPKRIRIPAAGEYFEKMYRAFNSGHNEIFRCYSLIYEMLYRITLYENSVHTAQDKVPVIKKAAEYMNNNYSNKNIRVADLYKMSGISGVYFCRIFKNLYGITPLEYLNRLRLEAAKKLLCGGSSVCETAYAVGFSDPLYFSKFFRKHTGLPPTDFVERITE